MSRRRYSGWTAKSIPAGCDGPTTEDFFVELTAAQAKALEQFFQRMAAVVERQRIAGRREGADLLGRLAEGAVSIAEGERQRAALMQSRAAGRTRR